MSQLTSFHLVSVVEGGRRTLLWDLIILLTTLVLYYFISRDIRCYNILLCNPLLWPINEILVVFGNLFSCYWLWEHWSDQLLAYNWRLRPCLKLRLQQSCWKMTLEQRYYLFTCLLFNYWLAVSRKFLKVIFACF